MFCLWQQTIAKYRCSYKNEKCILSLHISWDIIRLNNIGIIYYIRKCIIILFSVVNFLLITT